MKRESERIAAMRCLHPGRMTSREHWVAGPPQECCCHPQPTKTRGNPSDQSSSAMRSRANPLPIAPRSNSSLPLTHRIECSSGSKSHCGREAWVFSSRRRRTKALCVACPSASRFRRQAKAGSLKRIFSPGSQISDAGYVAVDAESAQTQFERIQKVEGGLCSLRGICFLARRRCAPESGSPWRRG